MMKVSQPTTYSSSVRVAFQVMYHFRGPNTDDSTKVAAKPDNIRRQRNGVVLEIFKINRICGGRNRSLRNVDWWLAYTTAWPYHLLHHFSGSFTG